jgi:hypothetical protein
LIPQAYTSRDMSEAYKWLQTLPASVREELKSMEQVVSLYLRAKRLGGSITQQELEALSNTKKEAPRNSQDFQKTLKELQYELQQFDMAPGQSAQPSGGTAGLAASAGTTGTASTVSRAAGTQTQASGFTAPHAGSQVTGSSQAQASFQSQAHAGVPSSVPSSAGAASKPMVENIGTGAGPGAQQAAAAGPLAALRLDPRSRHLLNEVREGLNLSSDIEVIRMSLVLAHKSLKDLLK